MAKSLPGFDSWVGKILGWEDPLKKEMATHSNILAWKIPWMEKPGGLQFMGSQRVRHDWAADTHTLCSAMEFSRQEYWNGLSSLLQGIFLTQGLNPGLLHCRQILYRLSHQGSSWCLVFFNSNPLMFQLPDLGCKNSYISCLAPLSHHALSPWSCHLRCCVPHLRPQFCPPNKT